MSTLSNTTSALLPLTHPEIEYRGVQDLKLEGLNDNRPLNGSGNSGNATFVDDLEVSPNGAQWKDHLEASELPTMFPVSRISLHSNPRTPFIFRKLEVTDKRYENNPPGPKLRVFFFSDSGFLVECAGDSYRYSATNPTVQWMQQGFGVSSFFFKALVHPLWTPTHEHVSFIRRGKDGKSSSLDGFYQSRNPTGEPLHHAVWFSHSLTREQVSTYFVCNVPKEAKNTIRACSEECRYPLLLRPISIDLLFVEARLWTMQASLRESATSILRFTMWEEDRSLKSYLTPGKAATAITDLHDGSRVLHILGAYIGDLQDNLRFLFTIQQQLSALLPPGEGDQKDGSSSSSISESLEHLLRRTEHVMRWQNAHRKRFATQIALFFNLANQIDTRTNLQIAKLTSEISVATQRDSSSMITVAIVTMFFLPGTFLSGQNSQAFFSMIFFDAKPDARGRPKVIVSPQVWIYAISTVVLTVLVFCAWGFWHCHRLKQGSVHFDKENSGATCLADDVANRSRSRESLSAWENDDDGGEEMIAIDHIVERSGPQTIATMPFTALPRIRKN
ncbi:unnamed protein product [Cyclocybe aegerita]|uniref:Uncharacterized protein n=1 Tax=Cyclocybe aegerita TaxID=1973307 RepID=A0A8S0XPQ2_CYCAE|nr:unnamed protein product [Cyclocybe aegerita]